MHFEERFQQLNEANKSLVDEYYQTQKVKSVKKMIKLIKILNYIGDEDSIMTLLENNYDEKLDSVFPDIIEKFRNGKAVCKIVGGEGLTGYILRDGSVYIKSNLKISFPKKRLYKDIACGAGLYVVLREDGLLKPSGKFKYSKLACGVSHCVSLSEDRTVHIWGDNSNGQFQNTPKDLDFVDISCGYYHSAGLKSDGTIITWGSNFFQQCENPFSNSKFVQVVCGPYHTIGLTLEGEILMWGNIVQFSNKPVAKNFVKIATSKNFAIGLTNDNKVIIWGCFLAQIIIESKIEDIQCGENSIFLGFDHSEPVSLGLSLENFNMFTRLDLEKFKYLQLFF